MKVLRLPEGFDVVASVGPDAPWSEYEDAGATWIVESAWPTGEWREDLERRVRDGPPVR